MPITSYTQSTLTLTRSNIAYLVKAIFLQDTWHAEVEWFLCVELCNLAGEFPVLAFIWWARDYHKK